jgi:hypothetical protein
VERLRIELSGERFDAGFVHQIVFGTKSLPDVHII